MLKKFISITLISFLSISIVGCSNKPTDKNTTTPSKQQNQTVNLEGKEDTGEGSVWLVNSSGDTTMGNPITIFADKDTQLMQIGLNSEGIDGSKLSYIYINGKLHSKEQLGESQTSLELNSDMLKPGPYIVQVVQYSDDTEAGDIVTLKTNAYEVKSK